MLNFYRGYFFYGFERFCKLGRWSFIGNFLRKHRRSWFLFGWNPYFILLRPF